MAAASILLLIVNFGWIYILTVIALGSLFVIKSYQARSSREPQLIWRLFRFSILYLFAVFLALIVDSII
jgi:protoheme IX farnesyltransferase